MKLRGIAAVEPCSHHVVDSVLREALEPLAHEPSPTTLLQ